MATATAKQSFLTAYSERPVLFTPAGSTEENVFQYEINKYGLKELVVTGTRKIQEEINSYREETEIENVLARCIAGDSSMLRPDGIYADVSKMPKNMIEARQAMQKLENTWNDLPLEIRNKYNNNLDQFIAEAGKESWMIDMGMLQEKTPEQATKTEKTEPKGEVTNES